MKNLNRYEQTSLRITGVRTAMSLEFGLILTGFGVLAMFSAIAVIIVACEILKRKFKEAEVETTSKDALVTEDPHA